MAAEKAHRLTKALRAKGFQAYEFHDRYSSAVTVGSFSEATVSRVGGGSQWTPEVAKIIDQTPGEKVNLTVNRDGKVGAERSFSGPPGVICLGTACYVKGAEKILTAVQEKHKLAAGETSKDKKLSLLTARCIGACGIAPAVVYDGHVAPKQTPESVLQKLESLI